MAPKSPSPYSPSSSMSPLPRQSHHFPSNQDCISEEVDDSYDRDQFRFATPRRSSGNMDKEARATPNHRLHHPPTPLHRHGKAASSKTRSGTKDHVAVSLPCDNCRPSPPEKISFEYHTCGHGPTRLTSMPSPNRLLKSIVSPFLTRKSSVGPHDDRQYWKAALSELANKLIETTRSRDEAILETSRLNHSMTELEKKLNRLEVYCHGLKSGLEKQSAGNSSPYRNVLRIDEKLIEQHFLTYVSEARNSVRVLSRLIGSQLPLMGLEVHEAIFALLQPHGIRTSVASTNPGSVVLYLESLLNRSFFQDFETVGFGKADVTIPKILNPADRCKVNFDMFKALKGMTWREVLDKGTKHFSEEFGMFCDRKMNEVAQMLDWNSAWSEEMLEAFFGVSKSVWLVHLLANSVHPGFSIFRVANGAEFDSIYMETAAGSGRSARVEAASVQVMVAPGFYVHNNLVKSKVLCRRNHRHGGIMNINNNIAQ